MEKLDLYLLQFALFRIGAAIARLVEIRTRGMRRREPARIARIPECIVDVPTMRVLWCASRGLEYCNVWELHPDAKWNRGLDSWERARIFSVNRCSAPESVSSRVILLQRIWSISFLRRYERLLKFFTKVSPFVPLLTQSRTFPMDRLLSFSFLLFTVSSWHRRHARDFFFFSIWKIKRNRYFWHSSPQTTYFHFETVDLFLVKVVNNN